MHLSLILRELRGKNTSFTATLADFITISCFVRTAIVGELKYHYAFTWSLNPLHSHLTFPESPRGGFHQRLKSQVSSYLHIL
jgi:hypothetical protein